LTSAISGETQTPSGASDGEVSVMVFVANYIMQEKENRERFCSEKGFNEERSMRTRDIKSTMPAALLIPNGTSSSGAVRPK
jgi:hypothetical protein